MAISDAEKIDFLWKKVIFGVTKTATNNAKDGPNETIASPGAVYASQIWAQGDSTNIPATPPVANTAVVAFKSLALTTDPTAPANQSWLAGEGDFIPPTFGPGYLVKVYLGDPTGAKAARLFPDTTGEEYVFDYVAGVLNFVATIPTNKAATIGTGTCTIADGVYIQVYKYTGLKGGSTTKSLVVADIAARNAITGMNAGDVVHVQDASGIPTDARAGEYANYLWDGSAWKLTGTQDSARSDSLTQKVVLTHESAGTISLGYVGNGARVVSVSVEVTDAFDGNMAVAIGDAGSTGRLMDDEQNDLQEKGSYVTNPVYTYPANVETEISITVTGTATVGGANVVITYA